MSAEGTSSTENEIKDPVELINVYKRKGYFDQKRKELVEEFRNNDSSKELDSLLTQLIDIKVAKDPSILVKNKGKISAIIQASLMSIADQPGRTSSSSSSSVGKVNKGSVSSTGATDASVSDEDVIIQKIHKLLSDYANDHTSESDSLNKTLTQQLEGLKSELEQPKQS